MLGDKISTKGFININCSEQFNPFDSHGRAQLEVTIE